mgnify:FL=1
MQRAQGALKTELKSLIFDVDGTLADTEEVHRQAFNQAFSEFGLDWNWSPKLYTQLLETSGGRERMRKYGADLRGDFRSDQAFEAFLRDLHQTKSAIYRDKLTSGHVPLRTGVARLIEEARSAGLVLGIATSSSTANLHALLDQNLASDWRQWFASVHTCDSVPDKKPSPAVYARVLAETGIPANQSVAFEDTVNGLLACNAINLPVVITTHYYTRHHHFPGAAMVCDGLGSVEQPAHCQAECLDDRGLVSLQVLRGLIASRAENQPPPPLAQAHA